jgi:hypothetical protein
MVGRVIADSSLRIPSQWEFIPPGINPRQGKYTPQIWNNSTKKRSDLVARISLNDFCCLAHVLLPYLAPTTLLCIARPRPDVTPPRASLLLCIALPR